MTVYEKIVERLEKTGCVFETAHHDPTYTSQDAARIRGVELHSGAKAIVVRGSKTKKHYLFVMPANLKLDSRRAREVVGEDVSFAQDVAAVTGCVPGSVPPFGSVIGLPTYVDSRLAENEKIHFNAGSLTDSITLSYADYIRLETPVLTTLAKEAL